MALRTFGRHSPRLFLLIWRNGDPSIAIFFQFPLDPASPPSSLSLLSTARPLSLARSPSYNHVVSLWRSSGKDTESESGRRFSAQGADHERSQAAARRRQRPTAHLHHEREMLRSMHSQARRYSLAQRRRLHLPLLRSLPRGLFVSHSLASHRITIADMSPQSISSPRRTSSAYKPNETPPISEIPNFASTSAIYNKIRKRKENNEFRNREVSRIASERSVT